MDYSCWGFSELVRELESRDAPKQMRLYYHKTNGGAEYLFDTFVECEDSHREGVVKGAKYVVRIDGDITKDAELTVRGADL